MVHLIFNNAFVYDLSFSVFLINLYIFTIFYVRVRFPLISRRVDTQRFIHLKCADLTSPPIWLDSVCRIGLNLAHAYDLSLLFFVVVQGLGIQNLVTSPAIYFLLCTVVFNAGR